MTKTWRCEICKNEVSELGAYAKLSVTKRAHLSCYTEHHLKIAFQDGRQAVLNQQIEDLRLKQEQAKAQIRVEWENLPRCTRCGRKMSGNTTIHAEVGEVVLVSNVNGVCTPCIQKEVRERAQAKAQPVPPAAAKPAEAVTKKAEEAKDRFGVIEID